MESVLIAKDCGETILQIKTEAGAAPTPAEKNTYAKKDNMARSLLLLSLDNKHCKLVIQYKTSKEIWEKLNEVHEKKSSASKLMMQREFFDLRMNDNEKAEDYVARAEYLYGQMKEVGINSIDEVSKVVNGLPKRFLNFISNWSNIPAHEQKLSILSPRLMAEELLHLHFKRPESGSALVGEHSRTTKKFNKPKPDFDPNKNKQGANSGNYKKGGKKQVKKCYLCNQNGHWRPECPLKSAIDAAIRNSSNDISSSRTNKKDHKSGAIVAEVNKFFGKSNEWIVDSGATEHMSFNRGSFTDYEVLGRPKTVKFEDDSYGEGIGFGTVNVETENGIEFSLTKVLYIPQLRRKLLSISAATKLGTKGEISCDSILLKSKRGTILFKAKESNGLYKLNLRETTSQALVSTSNDNMILLHERYGHANRNALKKMIKEKSVLGLEGFSKHQSSSVKTLRREIDCEACLRGKQTKKSYPSSSRSRATKVGERLHADMVGPICPSIGGKLYFCLFKDEYSNFRTIYFIKSKDEFLDCLQKCVSKIKSDTGIEVRKLFSDHATELTSNKAKTYQVENNIVHEMSAPFCPQQNGFIERDNRTVLEYTRTMLLSRKLPQELWGEAANTVVYLLNRLINSNTGSKTPYEIYTGVKPDVKNIRIFGSLVSHKRQQKLRSGYQKKMEPRSDSMVLVGYEEPSNYRIYDPSNKKIIITPEIIIDETKGYNFSEITADKQCVYTETDNIVNSLTSDQEESDKDESNPDKSDEDSSQLENINIEISDSLNQSEHDQHGPTILDSSQSSLLPTNVAQQADNSPPTEQQVPEAEESLQQPTQERRYPSRNRLPVNRYEPKASLSEALVTYGDEPTNYNDAMSSDESHLWLKAMRQEVDSLNKLQTWSLSKLPANRKAIKCKWVYKKKYNSHNQVERYRARLVAKGYSQLKGIDYEETFSPVVRLDTIRFILAYVAKMDLEMVHFDVATAFLYGALDEQRELYMEQPHGFEEGTDMVCNLNKSIYGLK